MTGVGVHRQRPDTAFFWGSWLGPAHRGRGLSNEMYAARIAWSRIRGLAPIQVSHRASNVRSKAANQRHGFTATGVVTERTWPDGTVEAEVFYELRL